MIKGNDKLYSSIARCLIEYSNDVIFVKDEKLNYVTVNRAFLRMMNLFSVEEVIGKTDFDLFSSDLAKGYNNDDKAVLKMKRPIINYTEQIPDCDGEKAYSSSSKYPLLDENNEAIGVLGISRDNSSEILLQIEREINDQSIQSFEAVIQGDLTNDLISKTQGEAWVETFKHCKSYSEALELYCNFFLYPEFAEDVKISYSKEKLLENFKNGITRFNKIVIHAINGKNPRYYQFVSTLYYSSVSDTVNFFTYFKDIDEDYRVTKELKKKALTDKLTGLLNREGMEDRVNDKLVLEKGNCALLFIDLDNFKLINDSYGHLFGDDLLKMISLKLKATLNENMFSVGRFGGDEFVVLVNGYKSREQLKKLIDKLILDIENVDEEFRLPIAVTCSIGVALFEKGKHLSALYGEADRAMYFAKINGKNQYAFFDEITKKGCKE